MDQDKYIEVTIIESAEEIPTSDTCSVKALNHEHDRSKVPQNNVSISSSFKSNIEHSFQKRTNCFNKMDQPLDIDLLLRYYACNSNMEKSINNVLKGLDCSVHQGCKDISQGPLVELGAASKICDSLKESSSASSVSRFRDILSKLRCLIGLCSNEKLEEILSNDPSMKMCKHCGVISCSKSLNPVEPRKSPPNTSYFLSTDIFSNDSEYNEDLKFRKQMKKSRKEQVKKCTERSYDPQKSAFVSKRHRSNKKNLSVKQETVVDANTRRVETMVAERENDSKTNEKISKKDEIELQDAQVTKLLPFKEEKLETKETDSANESQQTKIDSIFESKNVIKNNAGANFADDFSSGKRFDCKQKVDNVLCNKDNLNESTEKIVKDILYEKPKSQLREFETENCTVDSLRCNQNEWTDPQIENTPLVNIMAYLARGRPESLDKRKKELVSQRDETCVHSRCSNYQHSFMLHAGQTDNPQLNLDFLMHNKSKLPYQRAISESENVSKHSSNKYKSSNKHIELPKTVEESDTCLMEDDSLENCMKEASESDEVISSSSAENMIREWVATNNEIKNSVASKHSMNRLEPSNGKSIHPALTNRQRHFGTHSLKKTWRSMSSRRPKNSFGQTMSYTLDSKSPANQQSINDKIKAFRKIESAGGKKFFRKQSFELFKTKPMRILKSTEDSNAEILKFPGNHSLGDYFKNVNRRIVYNDSSLRKVIDAGICDEEVLWLYRKVLESTERMDWQNFQRFVEELHPNHKDLWRDICEVINGEARRLEENCSTEVCIEITSASSKENRMCDGEIVFEMDITLEEVKRCLHRVSTEKAQLDILRRVNEVIKVRNDDVCDTEALFNQAE